MCVSTCQLYVARGDIRMEDTPRFRTFALLRRIDVDTAVGFAGICRGIRGLPFDRGSVVFPVSGRRPWRWGWRVSPLWKSGQTVPIALQRFVPLATTEQIVSLLLESLCFPKLSLYRSNARRLAMEARYLLPAIVRACRSLVESKFPSPSIIVVVSSPDIELESPLLGIGGSCGGWGMLLD